MPIRRPLRFQHCAFYTLCIEKKNLQSEPTYIVKQRKNAIYHKLHLFFFLCIFVWIASSFCLLFFSLQLMFLFNYTQFFFIFSLFVWFCSFGRLSNIFVYVIELALMLFFFVFRRWLYECARESIVCNSFVFILLLIWSKMPTIAKPIGFL